MVTPTFSYFSNTSQLYHWVKGKSVLKLVSLLMITQISDIIMKKLGYDLVYSLAREMYMAKRAVKATVILVTI